MKPLVTIRDENVALRRLVKALSGSKAERLAEDMDGECKDHAAWYRAVTRARRWLEENR